MRISMKSVALFAAGAVFGMIALQTTRADNTLNTGLKINHVGMNVANVDETIDFYKKLGAREGFSLRNDKGEKTLTYLQISNDTFLELAPAGPDRPAGITHFGMSTDDVKATISKVRAAGITIPDSNVSRTKTLLTAVIDPNKVRFEVAELPPDSLVRQAMNSWK